MNEFEVIRRISDHLPTPPPEVIVPIGDDCAVLHLGDALWVVAAMGAVPRFVLASGGADDAQTTLRCMEGVLEACGEFGAYPLGGDTTGAAALTVAVAILGQIAHAPVL